MPVIGAQMIIFGKKYDVEKDADLLFGELAKQGYAAIEGGMKDYAVFKQKLDKYGLKHGGMHSTPRALSEKTQETIDNAKKTGVTDVCNSGMFDWKHQTFADVGYSIKILNDAGKKLTDAGLKCHYHNHDFEFLVKIMGKRIQDILLDELDPAVWDLCVDVAWVLRGGDDPASFLSKHADRVGYLHFKDWDGAKWVPLGKGKVNFKSIMPVLPQLKKVKWIMVEQDQPDGDPLENMAESRRYLKTLGL